MKKTTIFISYNPNSQSEATLAARLHTMGAVHDFVMYLPDRFDDSEHISSETKIRISRADYVVIFASKALSNVVKEEILFAYNFIKDKEKIFVVFDKTRKLDSNISELITPFFLDKEGMDQAKILAMIENKILSKTQEIEILDNHKSSTAKKAQNSDSLALIAIIALGLALMFLSILKKHATT